MRAYIVLVYSFLLRQWTVKRVYVSSEAEAISKVKSCFDEIVSVREY